MKNIMYKMSTVAFVGIFCLYFSACKKKDSIYHDYVNTIQTFDGSAMDYLRAQPKGTYDSLLLVLERFPFLQDSLTNEKVTFFAPVNKNFEASVKYLNNQRKAEGKTPIYLSDADSLQLSFMMCKYIIKGDRTSDAYQANIDGMPVSSIISNYPMHVKYVKLSSAGYQGGGPTVLNFSDTFGSSFVNTWVTTTTNAVNIKTNNATINIISPLHNFGFNEFTTRLDQ